MERSNPTIRKTLAFIALLCLLWAAGRCAGAEMTTVNLFDSGLKLTYRDLGVKKGTKFAVLAAPYENAWRGAKGNAAVSTAESFNLLAWDRSHTWLMVEYTTSGRERRVGWIHVDRALEFEAEMVPFDRCLLRVTKDLAALTDDPRGGRRTVRQLLKGDTVIGLWQMENLPWYYVECWIDGKPAWVFAPSDALEEVPLYHKEGTALVVHEGVTVLGSEWEDAEEDTLKSLPPGSVRAEIPEEELVDVEAVQLPASLRTLAEMALYSCHLRELVLPEGVKTIQPWAFYNVHIGTLHLPSTCTDISGLLHWEYSSVEAFDVALGSNHYSARDGVLFTRDGATLLCYPNSSARTHYDVPAGTRHIADRAFDDDQMNLPLQTISLPIGLQSIGENAFSGCGRLQSLAVPPTVTSMAPTALSSCVSLERLSLPPGLSASIGGWARGADLTRYNGDNGEPVAAPSDEAWEEEDNTYWYAWLDGDSDTVPTYSSAADAQPTGQAQRGSVVTIVRTQDGRAAWSRYETDRQGNYTRVYTWVSLHNLLPVTGETLFVGAEALYPVGVEPLSSVNRTDDGDTPWQAGDWTCPWNGDTVVFWRSRPSGEEEATFFLGDVPLYRACTGDARHLGILRASAPGERVWLYDAPGGEAMAHTFTGEQAEWLETRDGWTRVRTAACTGWVETPRFYEVPQTAAKP